MKRTLLLLTLAAAASPAHASSYDPASDLNGKDEETVEEAAITDAYAFKRSDSGEPIANVARKCAWTSPRLGSSRLGIPLVRPPVLGCWRWRYAVSTVRQPVTTNYL